MVRPTAWRRIVAYRELMEPWLKTRPKRSFTPCHMKHEENNRDTGGGIATREKARAVNSTAPVQCGEKY